MAKLLLRYRYGVCRVAQVPRDTDLPPISLRDSSVTQQLKYTKAQEVQRIVINRSIAPSDGMSNYPIGIRSRFLAN